MIFITEIRPHRRTKFFEIFSEAGFEFLASEKFLHEHGILPLTQFEEDDFEVIRAKAQLIDGIRKCTEILSRKDYSKKELQRKLCSKGIPEDISCAAINYMAEKGYQDDFRYAKRLAEVAKSAYGKKRVEQVLYHHGIEKETAREVLEEVFCDESEESEKLDRILLKAAKGSPLSDPSEKSRIYAKLARLGYGSSAITSAISRYEAERKDETH